MDTDLNIDPASSEVTTAQIITESLDLLETLEREQSTITNYNKELQSNIAETYTNSSNNNNSTDIPGYSGDYICNYGLNEGEKVTDGRHRNPGKYTDKSMYINLDRSDVVKKIRRRLLKGKPHKLSGICTNKLGRVRPCQNLLTPMNYRRVYLRTDGKLPRNLLMALTIDVSIQRLKTLDGKNMTTYYYNAARYIRTAFFHNNNDDEIIQTELALTWIENAIDVLNNERSCKGSMTVAEILENKYRDSANMRPGELIHLINETVNTSNEYYGLQEATLEVTTIAKRIKPTDIQIWGVARNDELNDIVMYKDNIFLGEARKSNVKSNDLMRKKMELADFVIPDDE